MSRKILKEGANVITINNQLVSVTEDYPFWRVNQNTSEQYWSSLSNDLRPKIDINLFTTITDIGSSNGSHLGFILAPNGSLYSCPNSSATIVKITPNPSNFAAPTIEYIGSFGTSSEKFASHHLVGDYIYYVPRNATYIVQLDTRNDNINTIGSFVGTTKWGTSSIADDGRIFCPPATSLQWLIIDVSNPNSVTTTLHTGLAQNSRTGCVNGGNGFIYTIFTVNANLAWTKIDTSSLVETAITPASTTYNTAVNFPQAPFLVGTNMFLQKGFELWSISAIDDSISNHGLFIANGVFTMNPTMGSDGWLYYSQNSAFNGLFNARFNPFNLSKELVTSPADSRGLAMCTDIYGNLYQSNSANRLTIRLMGDVNNPMTQNRLLSKYMNRM